MRVLLLVPMLLSLTVHEFAHAWSAYKLGDDTAERMGRMTLNPLVHIDPIGTILLPLIGVPFGWAKPVPVDPTRFSRAVSMSTGGIITAAAGPFSNLVMAMLSSLVFALMHRWMPETLYGAKGGVFILLRYLLLINVSLALFNMLPLPPLDGSRVVDGLMPYSLRDSWERFAQVGPFLLLGILVYGKLDGGILQGPVAIIASLFDRLVASLVR
ncbi:MAG: site-2 protease family protein [Deltaproteobacteria bacterium]|nr:site-2 protease family protein [Deltaproteobacteria bacterium]